jgi:hypothetical protein
MANKWLKSENQEESFSASSEFWEKLGNDLSTGEFWADRIKETRSKPMERLSLALENLPLPAAFRESAIALRALIREKRKTGDTYIEELSMLYWLAAIDSFSIPRSEVLKQPGYNVMEFIPGKLLKTLPFDYKSLGYEQLSLLKQTDIKWVVEAWGEPKAHSTLHQIHKAIWEEYELELQKHQTEELDRALEEMSLRRHDEEKNVDAGEGADSSGRQENRALLEVPGNSQKNDRHTTPSLRILGIAALAAGLIIATLFLFS